MLPVDDGNFSIDVQQKLSIDHFCCGLVWRLNFPGDYRIQTDMNVCTVLLLLLIPMALLAQPKNQQISETVLFDGEPYLAMNPANPQNLAAAWMSYTLRSNVISIQVRRSLDGGATWGDTVTLPHFGKGWGSADVSMTWRKDGALFLSYIDYLNNVDSANGGVFVTRSNDGGLTWSQPAKAIDAKANTDLSIDRPWIAVDNSTSANSGNLYICTKPAPWNSLPNHTYVTRSTDEGKSWSTEMVLDTNGFSAQFIKAPMGSPAVGDDGKLYIAYPYFEGFTSAGFALATSVDGGLSFIRQPLLQPTPSGDTLFKNSFRLLTDPQDAKHLVFVWPDIRNGDNDVYSSASSDAGSTWSTPLRINDDASGNGVVQDMIWPAFAADGTLAVVWRDRRNGTGSGYSTSSDTYYSWSRDSGKTWAKNVRLSDTTAPYDMILDNPGNDFMSADLSKDTLYATWADTRSGRLTVYFGKVAIGGESWVGMRQLSSSGLTVLVKPNPTSGAAHVIIEGGMTAALELTVVDISGRMVRSVPLPGNSRGSNEVEISLNGLADGAYWLKLSAGGELAFTKLVVRNETR